MSESRRSLKILIKAGRQQLSENFIQETITIGRSSSADFQVPVEDVSRLHAEICVRGSSIFVKDLGSINGTYLNGVKLEAKKEYLFTTGDEIEFGKKLAHITIESLEVPVPVSSSTTDLDEHTHTGPAIELDSILKQDMDPMMPPLGKVSGSTQSGFRTTSAGAPPLPMEQSSPSIQSASTATSVMQNTAPSAAAQKLSSEVVAQAQKASEQLLAQARKQQQTILEEIEAHKKKVVGEIEKYKQESMARVQVDKEQVLRQAEFQKEKIMTQAQEEAQRLVKAAEERRTRILATVAEEEVRLRAAADDKAQEFYEAEISKAMQKAEKTVEEASLKAESLLSQAQKERDHLLATSHAEAQKIFRESEEERRTTLQSLRQEVGRLQSEAEESAEATYKKANQLLEQAQGTYREVVTKADKESHEILRQAHKEANDLLDAAKLKAKERLEKADREKDIVLQKLGETVEAKTQEAYRLGEARAEELVANAHREVREIHVKNSDIKEQLEKKILNAKEKLEKVENDFDEAQNTLTLKNQEVERVQKTLEGLHERKLQMEQELLAGDKRLQAREEQLVKKAQEKKAVYEEIEKVKREIKDFEDKRNRDAIDMAELKRNIEEQKLKLAAELQIARDQSLNELEQFKKKETKKIEEAILDEQKAIKEIRIQADRKLNASRQQLAKNLAFSIKGEVITALKAGGISKLPDLNDLFDQTIKAKIETEIFSTAEASIEGAQQEVIIQKTSVRRTRLKRVSWVATASLIAAFAIPASRTEILNWIKLNQGDSPALQFAQKMEDQRSKRFDPPRTNDWFPSYVDSVLYSKDYTEQKLSTSIQDKWFKEIQDRMFKEQKVAEDVVIKLVSMEAALITQLKEQRDALHPDFVGTSLHQMRLTESETVDKMKELLNNEEKFKAYLDYSKSFYESQVSNRLPSSGP